jgi:starch phosphorylase
MVLSNPRLSQLITEKIGDSWIKNLDELRQLQDFVGDAGFRQQTSCTSSLSTTASSKIPT